MRLYSGVHVYDENSGGAVGGLQGVGKMAAELQCSKSFCHVDGQRMQVVHRGYSEDPHLDHPEPGQMAIGPHGQHGGGR